MPPRCSLLGTTLPIIILLIAACLKHSSCFGTINEPTHLGQHCEHERLSRAAFSCPVGQTVSDGICFEELSLMQLAGTSGPDGAVGRGFNGAVGSPDTLDPVPEGPEAHCDNADFLDAEGLGLDQPYPRTREEATRQLQICVDHLRERFHEGLDAADRMVNEYGRIIPGEVDIQRSHCTFSFPELQMHIFSRSKCSAIEGFGRALHGVQDFYAHSNWVDSAKPPYGPKNPPGLKRNDLPIFLDLRAENYIDRQVPRNLSTGCFGGILTDGPVGQPGHPLEPGSMDCTGRVTHYTLNKDNGIIDPINGVTKNPGPNTPRGEVADNFEKAVAAAIRDSKRQWMLFREEIRRYYGAERGNIMICSLVRDGPIQDCYGRQLVILREDDTFGEASHSRVARMQVPMADWLMFEMQGRKHKEEGWDSPLEEPNTSKPTSRAWTGEMQVPLAAAAGGSYDFGRSNLITEKLDFGSAMTELARNTTGLHSNKTAIVALASTQESHLEDQIGHLWHAGDEGIRVHLGLIPPARPIRPGYVEASKARTADLITAVLRSGGTFTTLHSESQIRNYVETVVTHGLTAVDNPRDVSTILFPGLTVAGYVTPESEPRRFTFAAHAQENMAVTVHPITSRLKLRVKLQHIRKNAVLKEFEIGLGGNATFVAELTAEDVPLEDAWYDLVVTHVEGGNLTGSGLFEISLESDKPWELEF